MNCTVKKPTNASQKRSKKQSQGGTWRINSVDAREEEVPESVGKAT